MNIDKLLPIGSVVSLKEATKKVIIMGILQTKNSNDGKRITFDYMGVPYPEGFLGIDTCFLFNHDDIDQVSFMGFADDEHDKFVNEFKNAYKSLMKNDETNS